MTKKKFVGKNDESQSGGLVHKQTTPYNFSAPINLDINNNNNDSRPLLIHDSLAMTSRPPAKPKRLNVASSLTPLLRADPTYEPFELVNLEVILATEMINKPWLTQALTAVVKTGKSLTLQQNATYEEAKSAIGNKVNINQVEKRSATLVEYFKIREGQERLCAKRLQSSVKKLDGNTSLKAECRLVMDRLVAAVIKSGCVQIVVDENDPTKFATNVMNILFSCNLPSFSESLSLELLVDLLSSSDDSFDKTKYHKNMSALENLYKILSLLDQRLQDTLFSFKNQRGGWKNDVLSLIKSSECKRKEEKITLSPIQEVVDIEHVKHQLSLVKIVPEIVNPDELDIKVGELEKLVSSLKKHMI